MERNIGCRAAHTLLIGIYNPNILIIRILNPKISIKNANTQCWWIANPPEPLPLFFCW